MNLEDTRTPRNDTNPSCEWQLPENADNGFEEAWTIRNNSIRSGEKWPLGNANDDF